MSLPSRAPVAVADDDRYSAFLRSILDIDRKGIMGNLTAQTGRGVKCALLLAATIAVLATLTVLAVTAQDARALPTFNTAVSGIGPCDSCHTQSSIHTGSTHSQQACSKCHTSGTATPPLPSACASCHGVSTILGKPTHTGLGCGTTSGCHGYIAPPTGIAASALSASSISLYWAKAASTSGVTGYRVERATASAGPWTTVASPTTNYSAATGLAANTTYYFRVSSLKGTATSAPSAVVSAKTRVAITVTAEQDYTGPTYTGTWTNVSNTLYSGSSVKRTTVAGSKVTVPFRGSAVRWIGTTGPSYGKVDIAVDGVAAATGLNLYATTTTYRKTIFTKSGLSDGAHTLTITSVVAGKPVDVDAFSVTGLAPVFNREEGTGTYIGTWSALSGTSYSGSSARLSSSSTASITFTFRGTGVTWMGTRAVARGKAKVYIDGVYVTTVDEFAAATAYRTIVWSKTGLALGTHTLKIMPAAAKNVASTSTAIDVDAISVR